jgi:hypothetical protein
LLGYWVVQALGSQLEQDQVAGTLVACCPQAPGQAQGQEGASQ